MRSSGIDLELLEAGLRKKQVGSKRTGSVSSGIMGISLVHMLVESGIHNQDDVSEHKEA